MTTITQKKKLSKGTWVLLLLALGSIVAVAVLAAIGYISLVFLTDWLVGVMTFGTTGWINAIIVLVLPFATGIFVCWALYRYFIGQKVTTAMGVGTAGGYSPTPTYPSAATSKDTETKIE